MYKRLIAVSIIILIALCGLCILGLYSIDMHEKGLLASRAAEFPIVAEQIRVDVKRKLDSFIQAERNRPYTDYQYYYVPAGNTISDASVRSPLGGSLYNSLAYGYFQVESDETIINPYFQEDLPQQADTEAAAYFENVKTNLLGALNNNGALTVKKRISFTDEKAEKKETYDSKEDLRISAGVPVTDTEGMTKGALQMKLQEVAKRPTPSRRAYNIPSLEAENQEPIVLNQRRDNVDLNYMSNQLSPERSTQRYSPRGGLGRSIFGSRRSNREEVRSGETQGADIQMAYDRERKLNDQTQSRRQTQTQILSSSMERQKQDQNIPVSSEQPEAETPQQQEDIQRDDSIAVQSDRLSNTQAGLPVDTPVSQQQTLQQGDTEDDFVQIRVEPFSAVVVDEYPGGNSIFPGQVFLLRHVQIEQRHFLQGFRLNENELYKQIKESAQRLLNGRRSMGFTIDSQEDVNAAHNAILVFEFGDLVLNLFENAPNYISRQVANLKTGYFAIVAVVFIAVGLAQVGLFRTASAQLKLTRKKDDFISAVSHELRTPLTTIRMLAEMLEKDWVKADTKRKEYYTTVRQEGERLSRLVENVLDFSRIQRGRKKYNFKLGNINDCINEVVDMMAPYAAQADFIIEKNFSYIEPFTFDKDAVMQIVINLLDNAIKYAKNAENRIVIIKTKRDKNYVLIEVQDHGPGIPRTQRKKVFEEFYRLGDESTREATGTGLGLALVKKFAQAHNGFVEILSAKPTGTIFRVALTAD